MNNNQGLDDFLDIDYKNMSRFLFSFSGNEFGIIGAIVGYLICQNLDIDEQNSLGNFFELIGQIILAIAAQNQVISNDNNNNNNYEGIISRRDSYR